MRPWLLVCLVAVALGCGSKSGSDAITTIGTIELQDIEGGAWLIRAENGTLYNPTNLPAQFEVVGARVLVTLVVRHDVASFRPGIVADIVTIDESCAGVACGAAAPALTLEVVDATSSTAVEGVVLTSLSAPAPAPSYPAITTGCSTGPSVTTCTVGAYEPGAYALDVTAPGYQTAHVSVTVPAAAHVIGRCCEMPYEPQTLEVRLTPAS